MDEKRINHCIFFSAVFAVTPHIIFSLPVVNFLRHPVQIFSTFPIRARQVLHSERVCNAVTYTLSGCINVHCNRPIPAHPPTHPAHPHPAPAGPPHHPHLASPGPPPGPPPGPTRPATQPHPAPPGPQPHPPTRPDQPRHSRTCTHPARLN